MTNDHKQPVWCFKRFGKSINELSDGRVIEIAGEHEDHYDPDFCIYNDVVVHHGDGTFDIFGYPEKVFPPTDFHTATLVGKFIYLIGNLGYVKRRNYGKTPVYRLDIETMKIEMVRTFGDKPGWISDHKAQYKDDRIIISGGKICTHEDGDELYSDNSNEYILDLKTMSWSKIVAR